MKYLREFKSFVDLGNSEREIKEHVENYISKLSYSEIKDLKREIEKLAKDNRCSVQDLANPHFVKTILTHNIEEGIGTWIRDNWYKLCNYIGIGGKIAGIVTFVGSLVLNQIDGSDTTLGIKVGVAAYIISNIIQSLRQLEVLKGD